MKYKNMKTQDILETLFMENELSRSTRNAYLRSVRKFENITEQTLPEILDLAEKEHNWKTSNLRRCLLKYRHELNQNYKRSTAQEYYGKIISILNHYEIDYGKLPKPKKHNENVLYDVAELPSQKTLKKCIELKNNILLKSATLFIASTGLSPVDLLKLTVKDYLEGTSEYHNYPQHHDILKAILEMEDKQVIATLRGHRQKTGTEYITFTSPEAIKNTNIYLQSREDQLTLESTLFKVSRRQFNKYYQDINEQLMLGLTSEGKAVFSPKNLRSYHATQLERAGMNDNHIDILEGRKPSSIIRRHYIKIDADELKQEYIECLPYLVVDDVEKIKTELELVREE
ncbi:integrase, partial [Methanosphaera sp.]|uniref:integrase n=1 Tax=Methanosphaera sp. TaxID=2666342 RepID=UPI0025CDC42D